MQAHSLLFCPRCNCTTAHARQAKYDMWGALSKTVERCAVCLTETTPGNGHEAPAADPPPVTLVLTAMEIKRGLFVRHLIARGAYSDEIADPGVWG